MKLRAILAIFAILVSTGMSGGEVKMKISNDALPVQGFGKRIKASSETGYRSHVPYAKYAIQIHSNPDRDIVVWESEPLPESIKEKFVEFVWIGGTSGDRPGLERGIVSLSMNGKHLLDFKTGGPMDWKVKGEKGVELSMWEGAHDMHYDRFGYMKLRVPASMVEKGKPATFTIVPVNSGVNSWTKIYTTPLMQSEILDVRYLPCVKKGMSGRTTVSIHYWHFGKNAKAEISFCGKKYARDIELGYNEIEFPVDNSDTSRDNIITMNVGGKELSKTLEKYKVRNWEINFVHITHTDIGYSRQQQEILAEHVRFIDYVLDYCDLTDDYPEESRFHWTCEGTWAVEAFLKSRPQSQIDRFVKRVHEGRIELTAMYYNFDGLTDEHSLAVSLQPMAEIKSHGIDGIEVAMQNDVNGIGWSMSEYLPDAGIKYLTMGVNNDSGIPPFDGHTYFWWESPSGNRMLTFYGAHYMDGNLLGIHEGDFGKFENSLIDYISRKEDENYPYDYMAIEYLGSRTDNSSPTPVACDMIRQWNEKYEWPKLCLRPYKEHMKEIEKNYGDSLPVIRGAWPDWWSYGFASGERETAAARYAASEMVSNNNLLSMAKLAGEDIRESTIDDCKEAYNSILFYNEHTYGYFASISHPFCLGSMEQRSIKASYAWEARRRSTAVAETATGYVNELTSARTLPTLTVYNPLSWNYSGITSTFVDYSVIPLNGKVRIHDEAGNEVVYTITKKNRDGAFIDFYVSDIPAFGFKQFVMEEIPAGGHSIYGDPMTADGIVSNEWYDIRFNRSRGSIEQIYDKELGINLLDSDAEYQMGEVIYETISRRSFNEQIRKKKDGEPVTDTYTRTTPASISPAFYTKGEIWDSWRFDMHTDTGMGDGSNLSVEYRVFKTEKKIEMKYNLTKRLETNPEGLYVAFPYKLDGADSYCEVPGGIIKVGYDQIQGTSNDWYEVQSFASVRNGSAQIITGSKEIPMMEFGGLNTGRFTYGAKPQSNRIYSFVINNYWTTNFNADQHGGMSWSYYITSTGDTSFTKATQFGWQNQIPVQSRCRIALPENKVSKNAGTNASLLTIDKPNVLIVSSEPLKNENAIILHLREVEGKDSSFSISDATGKPMKTESVNVIGEPLGNRSMSIGAYASKFVKILL